MLLLLGGLPSNTNRKLDEASTFLLLHTKQLICPATDIYFSKAKCVKPQPSFAGKQRKFCRQPPSLASLILFCISYPGNIKVQMNNFRNVCFCQELTLFSQRYTELVPDLIPAFLSCSSRASSLQELLLNFSLRNTRERSHSLSIHKEYEKKYCAFQGRTQLGRE